MMLCRGLAGDGTCRDYAGCDRQQPTGTKARGAPLEPILELGKSTRSAFGSASSSLASSYLIAVGPALSPPLPLPVPGAPREGECSEGRKTIQGMAGTRLGGDGSGLRSPAVGRRQDLDTTLQHPCTVPWPELGSAFASPVLVTPPVAALRHTGMYKTVNAFYFAAGV